jgi:hypothetical protein
MAIFLTKKYLSRRTFLRGSGVALGCGSSTSSCVGTVLAQPAAAPKTRGSSSISPRRHR